uniref:Uncharacterized protein n=1 Tax=Anguilla anguilla TaxID=7936 RepID=A0A0E9RPL0_ANGAN
MFFFCTNNLRFAVEKLTCGCSADFQLLIKCISIHFGFYYVEITAIYT